MTEPEGRCETCRHENTRPGAEPCWSCLGGERWELKVAPAPARTPADHAGRVRLSYWRNPRTGEERVYLRGLGETVWCDAQGVHGMGGRLPPEAASWAWAEIERLNPHLAGGPWPRAWAWLARTACREHERRTLSAEAEMARYARRRAWRILAGRAWLRLGWAWRWVFGRAKP